MKHERAKEKMQKNHELYISGRETPTEQITKNIPKFFEVVGSFAKRKAISHNSDEQSPQLDEEL